MNLGTKFQNLELVKNTKSARKLFGSAWEKQTDYDNNATIRGISVPNVKSMANLLLQGLSSMGGIQPQLSPRAYYFKPQSEKYREFLSWLHRKSQVLTHIDLNTFEMRGNVTITVVDALSYLRRKDEIHKVPQWILEYLKTQVKVKRYRYFSLF